MLDVHDRVRPSVLALREVTPRRDLVATAASSPKRSATSWCSVRVDRREAEARGRAVEPRGHRSLRVHARDLRRARPHRAGRRWRAAAHRRDRAAPRDARPVLRPMFTDGRYDIGQKIDFLRANIELALDRPDLGRARELLLDVPAPRPACARTARVGGDPARRRPGRDPRRGHARSRRSRSRSRDALGLVLAEPSSRPKRCRRSRTPRWTATRCAPPTPRAPPRRAPVRLRVVGELAGRARAHGRRSATGEAIRIMTGAPMPDGADAIVMVERTERDGDRRGADHPRRSTVGDHVRRRRRRPRGRRPSCSARHGARPRAPRRAREPSARPRCSRAPTCARRRAVDRRRARGGRVALAPGKIRDSNRPMLLAHARPTRAAEPVDLGIARDDEAE